MIDKIRLARLAALVFGISCPLAVTSGTWQAPPVHSVSSQPRSPGPMLAGSSARGTYRATAVRPLARSQAFEKMRAAAATALRMPGFDGGEGHSCRRKD